MFKHYVPKVYRLLIRWQIQKVAQLFYCQNEFSLVCGDVAKWPDDRLWNSLDLDLTCWIILSAKFSMKYIYESKNDGRSSCVLLDSSASALQKATRSCQLADAKRSSCTCIIFGLYVLYLGSYTFPHIHSFSCEDRIGSQLAYFFFKKII